MQLTIETISLIVVSLAALAIVSVIFLQVLSINIQVFKPSAMARVHDVKYVNVDNSTWFLISITYGDKIENVEVSSISGTCPIVYREVYTERTWEVYGQCPGDIRGEVLLLKVVGRGSESIISVKI